MAEDDVVATRRARFASHARVLQRRDFRLLFIGQTTSAVGGVIQSIAITWLVLQLTGSALALGGVLLTATIPSTLSAPIGGLLSDRIGPRRVMIWSDLIRAVCIATLALLVGLNAITMPALYGILAIAGAASGIFNPAASAMPPSLVPANQLSAANSLNQSAAQLAMIIGAPAGGAVIAAIGTTGAITLNAATFAISGLAVLLIAESGPAAGTSRRPSATRRMALQAVSYLRRSPWLTCLLIIDGIFTIAAVGPFAVGLPLLARSTEHGSAVDLGIMLSAMGVGTTIGMLWAGAHNITTRRGTWFPLAHVPQAAALIAVPLVPLLPASVLLALIGGLSGWSSVVYIVVIQTRVPKHLIGRVMSLVAMTSTGLVPLSQITASITAELLTPQLMLSAAGILMVIASLTGIALPALRRLN